MYEQNLPLFILHMAAAAALLIWSVRLVRTGVERAFAVHLRLLLRRSSTSRALAGLTGMFSAALLQSSTAVAILVAGFVSSGTLAAAVGLAILLGADLGSAIVVQMLLVRQTVLVPLLLLIGVALFLRGRERRVRQTGRILIGLALILVSLDMIRAATAPLVDSHNAAGVMDYLGRDATTAFILGAAFAWLVHSSVAAVLLFVTLVGQGLMPQTAGVAMVLGANLGGSMVAYVLTCAAPIEARRMIVSNLVLRGGGAALVLSCLVLAKPSLALLGATPAQVTINLHLLFNAMLALVALPFAGLVMRGAEAIMKPRREPALAPISALDEGALAHPERALSCAAREVLRMAETIEVMARSAIRLFDAWDDATARAVSDRDRTVREMHFNLKLYLAKLNRAGLSDALGRRSMDLSNIAVNLEAASDMIARGLVGLARRLQAEGVAFSASGRAEIGDLHDRVLSNIQLALSIMMTRDPGDARELVARKESVRRVEQTLQRQHLDRLREGLAESIETSSIHQETLRALKQVNASFSVIAHPILSETGDLLESRLAQRRSR
jgi:phosphate:Na+ symporter